MRHWLVTAIHFNGEHHQFKVEAETTREADAIVCNNLGDEYIDYINEPINEELFNNLEVTEIIPD